VAEVVYLRVGVETVEEDGEYYLGLEDALEPEVVSGLADLPALRGFV
jgi:hypothetical protein